MALPQGTASSSVPQETKPAKANLLHKRVITPLTNYLRQGMEPRAMAIAFLMGASLGLIPFPAIATIICTVLALLFRFNLGVVQLGNYAMYPFQLLLMLPLMDLGNRLLGGAGLPFSYEDLERMAAAGIWSFTQTLQTYILGGILVWAIGVVPLVCCTYPLLLGAFRRMKPTER